VQQALDAAARGRTTIAIAHRLSTVRAADVIFVVAAGEVVERGTHDELVQRGGVYADLYGQQVASVEAGAGSVPAGAAGGAATGEA